MGVFPRRREARWFQSRPLGRKWLAAAAAISALAVFAASAVMQQHHGDAMLFALAVPLTLGAGAWGIRGGIVLGVICSAIVVVWWIEHGQPGGASWAVSRMATCLVMGILLGWLIDSSRTLANDLAHHEEYSLDLLVTAGFDGRFTRVSPSVTRLLGYTRDELLGRPFLDFVHPDDVEATQAAVSRQMDGRELHDFQNRFLTKGGKYRWLEWASRPDLDAGEMIAGARDITERKDLEAREEAYQERLESIVTERTRDLEHRAAELEDLTHELAESNHEAFARLAIAAEYRDDDTNAHAHRVAAIATLIAAAIALEPSRIELIREAALLHDVGKVGIPDAVLLKRGEFTDDEFETMKSHTEIGRSILAGSHSEILRTAEEIAGCHHEWWDGTGYPGGLVGENIPLSARIVALADVFDALTHERPYKPAWRLADAVAEIHRLRGRQFDPDVVDGFDLLDLGEFTEGRRTPRHAYSHSGAHSREARAHHVPRRSDGDFSAGSGNAPALLRGGEGASR